MGLTIHYEQKNKPEFIEEKTALDCIDFVKEVAEKSGWKILGQWDNLVDTRKFELPSWRTEPEQQPVADRIVREVGISVHPHKDCESLLIAFDITHGKLRHYEDFGQPEKTGWIQESQFCKTHYAGFSTHRLVCRLLAAIDKYYVKLEVSDEGDYYGVWDEEKGKKRFGEYVAFVKSVGDQIAGIVGEENLIRGDKNTSGWKDDYIDHLARLRRENKDA